MTTAGQRGGRVFYGWWVVLAAGVGLSVHMGPIIASTFGVFLKPLSQEFGWSRTQISLAVSLLTLVNAGAVVVVGRLVDRCGARAVILPSALFFGLAFMSLYFLTTSLWHFYALYLVLGIIGSGTTPVAYSKVISHWFDQQRGFALALAMTGISVGAFILPPLAQALITAVGWRQAYVCLGLLTIAGTLPVVGLLFKESPQLMGLAPDGGPRMDTGLAARHGQEPGLSGTEA
jgi:sugar phosphate permease